MRKTIGLLALLTIPLAGCMQDPASRGMAGAVVGAAVADATDQNLVAGAALGGIAGYASCQVNVGPACY